MRRKLGGSSHQKSQTGRCGTCSSSYLSRHRKKVQCNNFLCNEVCKFSKRVAGFVSCHSVYLGLEWQRHQQELADQLREKVRCLHKHNFMSGAVPAIVHVMTR